MSEFEEAGTDLLARAVSARDLMAKKFRPLNWVVPGIFPEGMTLLNAAPKIGKSWMALGLAVACAEGGDAFGCIPVESRPVLYLALEDGERRLQDRLNSLLVSDGSDQLEFITAADPNEIGSIITLFFARERGRAPLVILDTLGRSRPATSSSGNQYQLDYAHAAALKAAVDRCPGAGLLVIHHTRKSASEDFLDAVSGTQGLAGAADTIAVLRRDREDSDAVLSVTSRDAPEGSYALVLADTGAWTLAGGGIDTAREKAAQAKVKSGLGEASTAIIDELDKHPKGATPKQIAAALKMSNDDVGRYLRRMVQNGRARKDGRGTYTPVRSVRMSETGVVIQGRFGQSDTSDTHPEGLL